MANSVISVRLDTEGFKNDLKQLENQFSSTMKEVAGWQKKSVDLTKQAIELEKQLAAARAKAASYKRGSAGYKSSMEEVNALRAKLGAVKAEQRAAYSISRELERQARSQQKSYKSLASATNSVVNAEKKSNAARNSSVNTLVRHIRKIETMIVGIYTLKKAYDLTIGASVEYNRMLERETIGLKTLIAQTTEYVDAQGRVADAMKAYQLAGKEAQDALKIIKEINVETPHTLIQTLSIYKLLVPQVKQYGGSLKEVGEITKGVSLLASMMGVQYQQILKTVDSLMSGQMMPSELQRAVKVVGITNAKVRELQRTGGDVVKFFVDAFKKMEAGANDVKTSMDGLISQFSTLSMDILGTAFEDIFEGYKTTLTDINKYLRENRQELVEGLKEGYIQAKNLGVALLTVYGTLKSIKALGALDTLLFSGAAGGAIKSLPPQIRLVATAVAAVTGALVYQRNIIQDKWNLESSEWEEKLKSYHKELKLKDGMLKRDQELIAKQKELGKAISEAYKSKDMNKAKELQAQMRKIIEDRKKLRESFSPSGSNAGYEKRTKLPEDFRKNQEFIQKQKEALAELEVEYNRIIGAVSNDWAKAEKAIIKYNQALNELKSVEEKIGKPNIDQEKLKKEYLDAQVKLKQAQIELTRTGVELNKEGLKTIEEANKKEAKKLETLQKQYQALKDKYTLGNGEKELKSDYQKLEELRAKGIINPQEYNNLLNRMIEKFAEGRKKAKGIGEELNKIQDMIGTKLENAMTQTFRSWMDGARDFGDLMEGMLKDIIAEIARIQVIKPFLSQFGFAEGGVISGGVQAFASGGIVSSPTIFPMANGTGLMGEAGPEAIMPVTRIGGDLGVKSTPSNVIINVSNETGIPVDMKTISETMNDGTRIINVVMEHAQTNPEFRSVMGIK